MLISLNWLKQYIDLDGIEINEMENALTMIGQEVEKIEIAGSNLENVVTAKIIEKEMHPDSDHLTVCKVDNGKEILQIVCGASNHKAGDKVVLAQIGAKLSKDFVIKKGKIRGKESCGMLCSEDELGIGSDKDGIIILPEDAPVGVPFKDYLGINDTVFELEITPNRPDCLSHIGIARELSAYYGKELKYPETEIKSSSMMKEVDRCIEVLELAKSGKNVALISSGDAGVYGMAGIMYEVIDEKDDVEIEVIPGITAANAAASIVGAPIMHDYVTISLSNLLTDWELIKKRLELAAQGDFIISLYNPKSKGRTTQIVEAQEIMLKYKSKDTPVAIVRNAGRETEEYEITTLEKMLDSEINMLTIVLIGNSNTFVKKGKIVTPRGYEKKYEY